MIRLIIFRVVVLPQPDGPTSVTNSPRATSRVRLSTAGRAPPGNVFVTLSRRIMISDGAWDPTVDETLRGAS